MDQNEQLGTQDTTIREKKKKKTQALPIQGRCI